MTRSVLRAGLVLSALAVLGSGCSRADATLRPDALLRDSLGLGDDDRVHRVGLGSADNRETVQPPQVTVRPGDYVEFVTQDRRVHALAFVLESLAPAAAEFLIGPGQQSSPPLVESGTRYVVSFADAPPGTYPYVVRGNGAEGRGAVVVAEDDR
jgi:plastocyanin